MTIGCLSSFCANVVGVTSSKDFVVVLTTHSSPTALAIKVVRSVVSSIRLFQLYLRDTVGGFGLARMVLLSV